MMMTLSATDGPESQSQSERPRISVCPQPGLSTPTALKSRWTRPRSSLNQFGPVMPIFSRKPLTTPPLKRKRKTVAIAIEEVTEGK